MPADAAEVLIIVIRWLHALAAVIWVGAAFAFLALPSGAAEADSSVMRIANRAYRELTDIAIPVFLLTGAILTFDRFARGVPTTAYVGVLVAKIALAFGMFHLAYRSRKAGLSLARTTVRTLCMAGGTIVLLATVLKSLNGI